MPQQEKTFGLSKARLEALTDGVFAIAMTLMVLNIEVPAHTEVKTSLDLWRALLALWPQLFNYGLCFAILMSMWQRGNRQHTRLKTVTPTYTSNMLVTLMFVCLLPFSTSLMGDYPGLAVGEAVFHVNLLALGLLAWLRYVHIRRHDHLLHNQQPTDDEPGLGAQLFIMYMGVPLLALAVTPIAPSYSTMSYLLLPLIALRHRSQRNEEDTG